jgi:hypothetical protein
MVCGVVNRGRIAKNTQSGNDGFSFVAQVTVMSERLPFVNVGYVNFDERYVDSC